jgi:RNA polymerase sigma-70 factor (ECF subfamily)
MNENLSDTELMTAIAKGDESALQILILRYQNIVYGTIVKMLGDAIEAEDIAQQVFLRVYKASSSYKPTASFKTWLFTILRNLVFNEHRRRGRAKLESINPPEEESGYYPTRELPDRATKSPSQTMLDQEMMQAIDQAILELPEKQRLAVVLRRYDEFSYEEIAQILKTSVSATKLLLFRARTTLRLALKAYLREDQL